MENHRLSKKQGSRVQILPQAIVTIAEETPGVYSCQLIQTASLSLTVRLSAKEETEEQSVWEALRARLAAYLAEQGITDVTIEKASEPPHLHPKSGKFQQVWSEVKQPTPTPLA